jgi:hypothetical protein
MVLVALSNPTPCRGMHYFLVILPPPTCVDRHMNTLSSKLDIGRLAGVGKPEADPILLATFVSLSYYPSA